MKAQFKMRDLRLLSFYLSIEVHHNTDGISVGHWSYGKKVLEGGRDGELQPCAHSNGRKAQIKPEERGDRDFCSVVLRRSTWSPSKRILRYIAGTLHYGCFYARGLSTPWLQGFNDFNLGGSIDTSKSMSGGIFFG
ncbi:uncharacterized protein [Setaria viridis]|uniref:uncharacterized protein n=1 Tax=Setaria viridis TaxID=4556 RepID=UPI003B3BE002